MNIKTSYMKPGSGNNLANMFFLFVILSCNSLHKWLLGLTSFGKNPTWLKGLFTCLRPVGGRLNDEFQTPWVSCISNAALLSLKLLLFAGQNISFKNDYNLFFNEECFLMFFNGFTFYKRNVFSLNVRLHIFLK